MLFNSIEFVLIFLPITLIGFFLFGRLGWRRAAISWLVAASAFFYGWFSVPLLLLLAILILFNWALGVRLAIDFRKGVRHPLVLAFGIAVNLLVLAYFKYTNFLIDNANELLGTQFVLQKIILPIGISFFTFQKIAYLVDAYRGEAEEYDLLEFSLFVMYFPQLIAGPIVHHREIIPQFSRSDLRLHYVNLAAGLALFAIGLVKKVMVADVVSRWSDPIFAAAKSGARPMFFEAWEGALAFTMQIYFDFSGYTDMALGLALMVGIRLPLNFNSPYKATNIIDFWRRWHMTLSRFLRDYVYIPLGGNRRGPARRYVNLMATMLLGGLWHGAAWTFVAWGGLHGAYLIINHAWHEMRRRLGTRAPIHPWGRWVALVLTFFAVVIAWVLFRAEGFDTAVRMLKGMAGLNGFSLPISYKGHLGVLAPVLERSGVVFDTTMIGPWYGLNRGFFLLGLIFVVWFFPNSQQLLARFQPALAAIEPARLWRAARGVAGWLGLVGPDGTLALNARTGVLVAALVFGSLIYQTIRTTTLQPFIYFQF
jgi:D-alanyl-lipoteichoic acid acyltransferase DltB (MBOAT superfamily)